MLAAMGIRRWHLRDSAVEAAPPGEPAVVTDAPSPTERSARPAPISVAWATGATGMLVYTLEDAPSKRFANDLMSYADWLVRRASAGTRSRLVSGEFRWPQVDSAAASPARAVAAFFGKHLDQRNWYGLTATARSQLEPWLPDLEAIRIDLQPLAQCMVDSAAKRQLWQQLQSLE
jgi:hypothetical protein